MSKDFWAKVLVERSPMFLDFVLHIEGFDSIEEFDSASEEDKQDTYKKYIIENIEVLDIEF